MRISFNKHTCTCILLNYNWNHDNVNSPLICLIIPFVTRKSWQKLKLCSHGIFFCPFLNTLLDFKHNCDPRKKAPRRGLGKSGYNHLSRISYKLHFQAIITVTYICSCVGRAWVGLNKCKICISSNNLWLNNLLQFDNF